MIYRPDKNIHWDHDFQTRRPIPGFFQAASLAYDSVYDGYIREGKNRPGEEHCTFQYTTEGRGIFEHEGKIYECEPGMGYIFQACDPTTRHYYPPDGTEPWATIHIAFTGEYAIELAKQLIKHRGPMFYLPKTHSYIKQLFQYEHISNSFISARVSHRLINELFMALMESSEEQEINEELERQIQDVKQYVKDNLTNNVTVNEIARKFGMAREKLSRSFKAMTGGTLSDFIIRKKVLLACRLLKETDYSLREISNRLGIVSQSQFTRFFKKELQVTPREFRSIGHMPEF